MLTLNSSTIFVADMVIHFGRYGLFMWPIWSVADMVQTLAGLCAGLPVKTSHCLVYCRRTTHGPPILGILIEEVRTIFETPKFFDPTSSFASRSIENLWENATTARYACDSVDLSPKNDQIKLLKPA